MMRVTCIIALLPYFVSALALRSNFRYASVRMAANTVTFEQALETAPDLCQALQAGNAPDGLGEFLSTSAGSRGFFVHYLTNDDFTCADASEPPSALITSLEQSASDATIEIMLMNVVMSAGTAVLHERAGNTEQASSSRRTSARARILVNALLDKLPAMQSSLTALNAAVASENGREVLFLQPGTVAAEGETSFVLAASEEEAVDMAGIHRALEVRQRAALGDRGGAVSLRCCGGVIVKV